MYRKTLLSTFVVLFTVAAAGTAMAQSTTGTLNVSATVIDNVRITALGNLAFGNYDPTAGTNLDGTSTLSVKATKSLAYKVHIGSDRVLTDATNNLNYELYSDSGRTAAWGSTLATGESYTSTTGTANNDITLYGRIAANQDVPANAYTDTVTVTVEW